MRLSRISVTLLTCLWVCMIGPDRSRAADLEPLLRAGRVPGLAYSVVRGGKVVETRALGIRDASTGAPVDENTIFEAASLSKPVFTYAVLQLVDAGLLSLDAPLSTYVPGYVKDDPSAALITVRHVLSQSSGLPNWRGILTPLKTYFAAGERFSYSGEGFIWLQRVVEKVTGKPLNDVMTQLVFEPLQMRRSSYVWRDDFDANFAVPHDAQARPDPKRRPKDARSASTLHTTAADYARFLQAVLNGARLKPTTAALWLTPQIALHQRCIECISKDVAGPDQHIAWGLGWGLEPDQGTFFHWGDNDQFKAFVVGSIRDRSAVVVFTNGHNGMAIMPDVIDQLQPGSHPAFQWLDYPKTIDGGTLLDWFGAR